MSGAVQLDPSVLDTDAPPVIPEPADAAPKRGRGRPPGAKTGSGKPRGPSWAKAASVEKSLNEFVGLAAAGLVFVNREDSRIIAEGGPRIVHELVELAKVEPALRRYLELSAAPGKYGPLIVATLAVIIPVMVNHNLIPQVAMFGMNNAAGGD